MSRSKWKGPVVCLSFLKKTESFFSFKSYSRRSQISSASLQKRIHIHTGFQFRTVVITSKLLGFKLGDFALTKKRGLHVSKLKKNLKSKSIKKKK